MSKYTIEFSNKVSIEADSLRKAAKEFARRYPTADPYYFAGPEGKSEVVGLCEATHEAIFESDNYEQDGLVMWLADKEVTEQGTWYQDYLDE